VRALLNSNREKKADHVAKLMPIIACDAILESKTGILYAANGDQTS
jgi:hypothetical protein